MTKELKTGATRVTLIQWAQTGKATRQEAIDSGRAQSPQWMRAIDEDLIRIDKDTGRITATPEGEAYLAERLMTA